MSHATSQRQGWGHLPSSFSKRFMGEVTSVITAPSFSRAHEGRPPVDPPRWIWVKRRDAFSGRVVNPEETVGFLSLGHDKSEIFSLVTNVLCPLSESWRKPWRTSLWTLLPCVFAWLFFNSREPKLSKGWGSRRIYIESLCCIKQSQGKSRFSLLGWQFSTRCIVK